MDPVFVARVDGLSIYRLFFGGYAVRSIDGRLLDVFDTIEQAFLFCGDHGW